MQGIRVQPASTLIHWDRIRSIFGQLLFGWGGWMGLQGGFQSGKHMPKIWNQVSSLSPWSEFLSYRLVKIPGVLPLFCQILFNFDIGHICSSFIVDAVVVLHSPYIYIYIYGYATRRCPPFFSEANLIGCWTFMIFRGFLQWSWDMLPSNPLACISNPFQGRPKKSRGTVHQPYFPKVTGVFQSRILTEFLHI